MLHLDATPNGDGSSHNKTWLTGPARAIWVSSLYVGLAVGNGRQLEGFRQMPMVRSRYPENWEQISYEIRFVRAGGKCEGSPAYPECRAEHGKPHPVTGSIVVLTTAHIGAPLPDGMPGNAHNKMDVRPENLRAWCQRCHLTYDLPDHIANRKRNRLLKLEQAGQLALLGSEP